MGGGTHNYASPIFRCTNDVCCAAFGVIRIASLLNTRLDFLPHRTRAFLQDEIGAVTVDWVVLTAAIVGLGIAVVAQVRDGSFGMANAVSASLASGQIGPLSFSDPTYSIQRLTADQLEQWTATFAAQSNTELQASAQLRYDQCMTHVAAQQWTQAQTAWIIIT